MKRYLKILTILILTLTGSAFVYKQINAAEPAFFTAIQDLPVMPGTQELSDQTLVFDKPEGRIIEAVARLEGPSREEVKIFYEQTLPALGWQRIADNSYVRQDESLSLSFETQEGLHFLKIMLAPKPLSLN